ncbi:hypothetical protein HY771_03760 [Candidatus Uhrbacteria bacterium]|nr:hypothetical protein [Candidatus Uhrbacteria bacterium]
MEVEEMGAEFQCAVCQNGKTDGVVFLCTQCAHPERVRTYCANCGHRLDFSLEKAKRLFQLAGLSIAQTGIVFRYTYCPVCSTGKSAVPTIFAVHQDGFSTCLAAA